MILSIWRGAVLEKYLERKMYYKLKTMFNNFTVNDFLLHLDDNKITKEKIEKFLTMLVQAGILGINEDKIKKYYFKIYTE
jgi:hypothetical protein